jgi:hypothetical protein
MYSASGHTKLRRVEMERDPGCARRLHVYPKLLFTAGGFGSEINVGRM